MNKRLATLIQMTSAGTQDPFVWYALALEYRKEGRVEEALATFTTLRERNPDYLPMYLMAGQMLLENDRREAAREWLGAGIALARRKGDGKTLSELEATLDEASDEI
ncbi:MAG: tetratricopeptide repeat protein [Pseudomonadota bacterium]|nr:MAG: tetratricopeptide repeat-containing protein [Pseudomonadota bacterium]